MSEPSTSYEMLFGEEALSRLPGVVPKLYLDCIQENLARLRADPTNLATRSPHPYPGTKVFEFVCTQGEDHGFVFRTHFYFNPEETHICVFDVTVIASY